MLGVNVPGSVALRLYVLGMIAKFKSPHQSALEVKVSRSFANRSSELQWVNSASAVSAPSRTRSNLRCSIAVIGMDEARPCSPVSNFHLKGLSGDRPRGRKARVHDHQDAVSARVHPVRD